MPELPEVETVRRDLEPLLVGRVVRRAALLRRDVLVVPGDPGGGFARQHALSQGAELPAPRPVRPADLLQGERVAALRRRGKQLAIIAERGRALIVQLGMSGQLLAFGSGARSGAPLAHVHASWRFDDGSRLFFRDPRRFGGLRSFPGAPDLERHWSSLGPDALTIDPGELARHLARTSRTVKAALLDQSVLAGVGNIYADEALFDAGIHPATPSCRLEGAAAASLAEKVRAVLARAIAARGSTLRDFASPDGNPGAYQSQHRVYGRSGLPCISCGTLVTSAALAGRTTSWCPNCQPRFTAKSRQKPGTSAGFPHRRPRTDRPSLRPAQVSLSSI